MTASATFKVSDVTNQKYPSWDDLQKVKAENPTAYIKKIAEILKEGTCPITLRKCYELQHSSVLLEQGLSDGQDVRIKALAATIIGGPFCLTTRAVRTVWRTAFLVLPLGPLMAYGKSSRYNIVADKLEPQMRGEVAQHCVTALEEWVDLFASVGTLGISTLKILGPRLLNPQVEAMVKYYVVRISERGRRDDCVSRLQDEHRQRQKEIKNAWRNGRPPVVMNPNAHVVVEVDDDNDNDNNAVNTATTEDDGLVEKKRRKKTKPETEAEKV